MDVALQVALTLLFTAGSLYVLYRVWKATRDVRVFSVNSPNPTTTGFGRRNPHCSNCGDERGGDFGHAIGECLYRRGMTAEELAATMPEVKAVRYWESVVDAYFERELGS